MEDFEIHHRPLDLIRQIALLEQGNRSIEQYLKEVISLSHLAKGQYLQILTDRLIQRGAWRTHAAVSSSWHSCETLRHFDMVLWLFYGCRFSLIFLHEAEQEVLFARSLAECIEQCSFGASDIRDALVTVGLVYPVGTSMGFLKLLPPTTFVMMNERRDQVQRRNILIASLKALGHHPITISREQVPHLCRFILKGRSSVSPTSITINHATKAPTRPYSGSG